MKLPSADTFGFETCATLLSQLVEVNTCQPAGNEAALVDFITQRYPNSPVQITRLDHSPGRASLVVKLPGSTDSGSLALVGHLDTVPVGDPAAWETPPLTATIKDNSLYGRGAADMKGGVAAMLLALDGLLQNAQPLTHSVYFCFTADEEKDGIGAQALCQSDLIGDVSAMLICEPSRNGLGLSEKGAFWVRVSAVGVSCHASRPELGANALDALLVFIEQARQGMDFSVEHPYLGRSTMSLTRLSGGTATNVIPAAAELELDIRTLPGVSHRALEEKLIEICIDIEAEHPQITLNLEIINNRPSLETEETDGLVLQVQQCASALGIRLEKRGLHFYTDASQLIPKLGIPFVILGPGDDREAHTANEKIEVDSVANFAQLYTALIKLRCS